MSVSCGPCFAITCPGLPEREPGLFPDADNAEPVPLDTSLGAGPGYWGGVACLLRVTDGCPRRNWAFWVDCWNVSSEEFPLCVEIGSAARDCVGFVQDDWEVDVGIGTTVLVFPGGGL